MGEVILENTGRKYSEMLMQIYETFETELPDELCFEEVLIMCIDAWNLAIFKNDLGKENYQKEISEFQYGNVIDKMVSYKIQHFPEQDNIITDYSLANDTLQVKSQTRDEHWKGMMSFLMNTNLKK